MECSLTWDGFVVRDGPLWKAIIVLPGRYRIKLGPVEVYSRVHPLRLILAIESLAKGATYLLSNDFEGMGLEDEADYTTLISSCRAFEGFFLLTLGLPEDFGVIMKRKTVKSSSVIQMTLTSRSPRTPPEKPGFPRRSSGSAWPGPCLTRSGGSTPKSPAGLRDEYLRWMGSLRIPGV